MSVKLLSIIAFAVIVAVLIPTIGFATETVIANSLCNAIGWMGGRTGKALVTLGVLIIGILALLNKVSWGFAILHAVGGALIFEAAAMVTAIADGGADC